MTINETDKLVDDLVQAMLRVFPNATEEQQEQFMHAAYEVVCDI